MKWARDWQTAAGVKSGSSVEQPEFSGAGYLKPGMNQTNIQIKTKIV